MFQKTRYEQIYAILQERQSATVQYLQKRLFVSEATIRRDIAQMEQDGLIQRVWGGAMLKSAVDKDPPSFVRAKTNNDKKEKIAEIASKFITENSSIFMDGSTTVMHLIPYLAKYKQISAITNGLQVAQTISEQCNINVHLIGGQIFENRIMTGYVALENVKKYHTDICFFSCSGLSAQYGITGMESKSVEVCHEMIYRATTRVLLCDTSKAGETYLWNVAQIADVDYVVMDRVPDDRELVEALGTKLITSSKNLA